MKTLKVELEKKQAGSTQEYTVLSENGDIIYQTYTYNTACAVLDAIGAYNTLLLQTNKHGTRKSKSKEDVIYKHITEMQKKAVSSSKHSRKNTLNYFYGENSTVICSMTEIAVFPKHIDRPPYLETPEKDNYDKILNFFTYEQKEILSIKPVIANDDFHYQVIADGSNSYRAGEDGNITAYLDKRTFYFLLDIFGSIEEIQKNIVFRDSGFITFELEGIKFLYVCKIGKTEVITQEDFSILNADILNDYSVTNQCSFVTQTDVEKHMIKATKMTDIKKNLQAFFNFEKAKTYKILYSQLLKQAAIELEKAMLVEM